MSAFFPNFTETKRVLALNLPKYELSTTTNYIDFEKNQVTENYSEKEKAFRSYTIGQFNLSAKSIRS